eukprot:364097-Chlamydomonas_euryale.AAC.1
MFMYACSRLTLCKPAAIVTRFELPEPLSSADTEWRVPSRREPVKTCLTAALVSPALPENLLEGSTELVSPALPENLPQGSTAPRQRDRNASAPCGLQFATLLRGALAFRCAGLSVRWPFGRAGRWPFGRAGLS